MSAPVCPWCIGYQSEGPVAFTATAVDEHGRAMVNGACRRHTAALLAWFTDESRTGNVNVRRAAS